MKNLNLKYFNFSQSFWKCPLEDILNYIRSCLSVQFCLPNSDLKIFDSCVISISYKFNFYCNFKNEYVETYKNIEIGWFNLEESEEDRLDTIIKSFKNKIEKLGIKSEDIVNVEILYISYI